MRKYAGRAAILAELKSRINSGQFGVGQRLPSERVLASEFGVSRASVQGAIKELQNLGLLDRTPNCRPVVMGAGSPNGSVTRPIKDQIAVWIYPNLDELGASMLLQGMRKTLGPAGFNMVIGCPESDDLDKAQESEEPFLRSLMERPSIAGAIVWQTGSRDFRRAYDSLVEANIPLVFVDREPPEPIVCDVVMSNNRRAARAAVRHLVDLGHRKIAMIVNREHVSSVEDRFDGYVSVLREDGIPFREEYVIRLHFASRQMQQEHAHDVVNYILGLPDPPTALFAVNDQIAMFVMDALTQRGIAIPADISVVGFDWLMRWLPSGGNLTTVHQQFESIGRVAAERLLERISARSQDAPRQILLDAPVVVRQSTGAPRPARARLTGGVSVSA